MDTPYKSNIISNTTLLFCWNCKKKLVSSAFSFYTSPLKLMLKFNRTLKDLGWVGSPMWKTFHQVLLCRDTGTPFFWNTPRLLNYTGGSGPWKLCHDDRTLHLQHLSRRHEIYSRTNNRLHVLNSWWVEITGSCLSWVLRPTCPANWITWKSFHVHVLRKVKGGRGFSKRGWVTCDLELLAGTNWWCQLSVLRYWKHREK